MGESGPSVGSMLADATAAAARGDLDEARELAAEVLRRDPFNREAQALVRDADQPPGELRRLTILFCDLVGSTSMSTRQAPGTYGRLLERYHRSCAAIVERHGGCVTRRVGDGVLALFGHPAPLGDDTRRAVRAGLALAEHFGADPDRLSVRVAVHHGAVHLDLADSEIYGFAPNLAARLHDVADPNSVVVSDQVVEIVGDFFDLRRHEPTTFKGIDEPIEYFTVVRERAGTVGRTRTPLVDRKVETARVLDLLDRGQAVVIRGDVGVGRSRVLAEVVQRSLDRGVEVRQLDGTSSDSATAFGGAAGLFRVDAKRPAAAGSKERLARLVADVDSLALPPETVAVLAPVLGIDPAAGYEPVDLDVTKLHDRIVEAGRAWLCALRAQTARRDAAGLLVAIDDVHVADRSSVKLFETLAREPIEGVQFVATVVVGHRSISGRGVETVELDPLSEPDAAELLDTFVTSLDVALDAEVAATILRRSEGNPWCIEELLADERRPAASGRAEDEAATRLVGASNVPPVLYEPLLARLYAPGIDIGVATAAATIGSTFSRSTLADLVRRSADRLASALDAMCDGGIVEAVGGDRFRFTHSLLRDVAYELQPVDIRRSAHRAVGTSLARERIDGRVVPWSVIARHCHAADDARSAIDAYERAADEALSVGALGEGRAHLSASIDLLASADAASVDSAMADAKRAEAADLGPAREATLRLKRAFLLVSTGGNADPRARADYERCEVLAAEHLDGPDRVQTLGALWGHHVSRGDIERSRGLLDAIRRADAPDDPLGRAENDAGRGLVEFFCGRFGAATHLFRLAEAGFGGEGAEMHRRSRWSFPNDPAAVMHGFAGVTSWIRGDVPAFTDHAARARRRVAVLDFPDGQFSACHGLYLEAWALAELGEIERSLEVADELQRIGERHGFDFWRLAAVTARSITTTRQLVSTDEPDPTDVQDCSDRLGQSELIAQVGDSRSFVPCTVTFRALLSAALGRTSHALALLAEAERIAEETGSRFYLAETLRHSGRLRYGSGDERGLEGLAAAAALAADQGALVFELRALADLADLAGIDAMNDTQAARLAALHSMDGLAAAAGPPLPARPQPAVRP